MVQQFRDFWYNRKVDLDKIVSCEGAFGGQSHLARKVLLTLKTDQVMAKIDDMKDMMGLMEYRTSARMLVRGSVGRVMEGRVG